MMIRVAIDVGHADGTGARGNGLEEHEVAQGIAEQVRSYLESFEVGHEYHVDLIDFPSLNNTEDLQEAVRSINAGNYHVCLSIHCDASDNASAKGAHVCYCSERGKTLADEVALGLCPLMPGRAKKTVQRRGLYFLRKTKPVAVLVECGFITNADDARVMRDEPWLIGRAIALRVAAWCDDNLKKGD